MKRRLDHLHFLGNLKNIPEQLCVTDFELKAFSFVCNFDGCFLNILDITVVEEVEQSFKLLGFYVEFLCLLNKFLEIELQSRKLLSNVLGNPFSNTFLNLGYLNKVSNTSFPTSPG
mgnify:CR=1 FL=1